MINLNTLKLDTFNKNNPKHLKFLKKIRKDKVVLDRFQGFCRYLLHNFGDDFFDRGFLIILDQEVVGYVEIGNFNLLEKDVYLRCAIDQDHRGKSIGKALLKELTDYIFLNYPFVNKIKLKIADDNISSLKVALACGYKWEENNYYVKINPLKDSTLKR